MGKSASPGLLVFSLLLLSDGVCGKLGTPVTPLHGSAAESLGWTAASPPPSASPFPGWKKAGKVPFLGVCWLRKGSWKLNEKPLKRYFFPYFPGQLEARCNFMLSYTTVRKRRLVLCSMLLMFRSVCADDCFPILKGLGIFLPFETKACLSYMIIKI